MFRTLLFLLFPIIAIAQSNFSALTIPSEIKESANSVLIDEHIEIDLSKEGKMIEKTYRVVAVLNELGNRSLNTAAYYDEGSKVKNIEAYLYDAFGNEVEHYRQRDFKDVSVADGFSLYSDDRALYLEFTPTSYPYTMVFVSETESNSNAFIRPWYPLSGYARGVIKSKRTITFEPQNKLKYKSENLEGHSIKIEDNPGQLIASASNIKPLLYEEEAPPVNTLLPSIKFALDKFYLQGMVGFGSDWDSFGRWMNKDLLTGVNDLPSGTLASIRALVKNETTNEAKARKIYQYVQDKVRYISVQIGIGGWKPMLASEVDKLGYGDCKALTNYTKTLLDAVGVPSYYTVLYAGEDAEDIDKDFTSMQGNHVILGVPNNDEIIWLECTSQEKPFGFMGNFTDDRDVVAITPEGGKIMHTTIYAMGDNLQETKADVVLTADGTLIGTIERVSKGLQYDNRFRISSLSHDETIKYYKSNWGYLNNLNVAISEIKNDREEVIFTETLDVSIPGYATLVGEEMLLEVNVFNRQQNVPPRMSNRKQKLFLDVPFNDLDKITIKIPEGYMIDGAPEDKLVETDFGSYSVSYKQDNTNTIDYIREVRMKKGVFPPEKYNEYRSFKRAISKLDKTKILIKPSK